MCARRSLASFFLVLVTSLTKQLSTVLSSVTPNLFKEKSMLEPHDYTVKRIEGEYAILESEENEELFIAMALLPEGVDVGTRLHYEMMEYTIVE